ncbi:MAG: NAD(P)H-binding protein, partial [Polyangiales bacterium]
MRVAIAGASGFIGRAVARKLRDRMEVVGIARSVPRDGSDFAAFRTADLFNLRETEHALEGADVAVYLVHSMLPSARLTQGNFADFDLVCADNFARAAAKAGVRQIVYLGGLVPEGAVSPHLASRREVEATLAACGVPVTVLRAGLVLGGGGSSFNILAKLVRRLPVMILPRWTETHTQAVALEDVIALLVFVVGRPECEGQTYDVGAPEVVTYRELMTMTADVLGVRRPMLPVPLFTPALSRLWVSLVTGAPKALVAPLVESLRHEMVARDLRLAKFAGLEPTPTRVALEAALAEPIHGSPPRRASSTRSLVRSVQRMRLPDGKDAEWAAREYVRWLPRALSWLIRAEVDPDRTCRFFLLAFPWPLLVLTYVPERSTADRQLFFVTGGLLVSKKATRGRFELRQ